MINRIFQCLIRYLPPYFQLRALYRIGLWNGAVDPEMKSLVRFLRRNGRRIALDIGANNGVTAFVMSKCFQQVHAFEANSQLVSKWTDVAPRNVKVHSVAVSNQLGSAILKIPVVNGQSLSGWASLDTPLVPESSQYHEVEVEVPCTTIDKFCEEHQIDNIDFIKIDVEGHELAVLEGAAETLRVHQPWLIVETTSSRELVQHYLKQFGYTVYDSSNCLEIGIKEIAPQNVVFSPNHNASKTLGLL